MRTMCCLRQENPSSGKNEALREAQDQMASGILRPGAIPAAPDRGVSPTASAAPPAYKEALPGRSAAAKTTLAAHVLSAKGSYVGSEPIEGPVEGDEHFSCQSMAVRCPGWRNGPHRAQDPGR